VDEPEARADAGLEDAVFASSSTYIGP